MKVSYEGTDVLICDGFLAGDKPCRSVIACTKEAEDKLYTWAVRLLGKTGVEIGFVRSVFGLTFYADTVEKREVLNEFISEKKFKTYHGFL